jgi:hypothetical protein
VVLEGVDKYNNLFGSVFYPEADKPANLAEALMSVSGSHLDIVVSVSMAGCTLKAGCTRVRQHSSAAGMCWCSVWEVSTGWGSRNG